jgi:hypothetical protein
MSVGPRNRYAEADTAAPLAITILMNARRVTLEEVWGVCSWVLISDHLVENTRTRPADQEQKKEGLVLWRASYCTRRCA